MKWNATRSEHYSTAVVGLDEFGCGRDELWGLADDSELTPHPTQPTRMRVMYYHSDTGNTETIATGIKLNDRSYNAIDNKLLTMLSCGNFDRVIKHNIR